MLCESIYKCWGDCVRWIIREIHVDPWWCVVHLGIEQQYGEIPDNITAGEGPDIFLYTKCE